MQSGLSKEISLSDLAGNVYVNLFFPCPNRCFQRSQLTVAEIPRMLDRLFIVGLVSLGIRKEGDYDSGRTNYKAKKF